ncbi:Mannan endo-1,6-alpha-mannosidase DCW1 [Golovinomyces cichoracearum]|uniref:mannan endo-1,6-alpha-mannosidase n=1 Tax=Golovinomyces cichoracearum TaxID=62708 RepID=A0A420IXF1_9PEZI|nr:Mannan endo-1,6-alpha-mannosidase DCW1 [Golovinomyces cichoracearum]
MISLFLSAMILVMTSFAIDLDTASEGSIKNASSIIAYGLMKYYTGNVTNTLSTIAVLPPPYYWWESGAMWGAMVDYYHYTNDKSYTEVTGQALLSQAGPNRDLMVPLHVKDEGNDDQAFWGFATMSAAEKNFPNPSKDLTWIELTQNLWNSQARRWDESTCGGGLRWQIFESNKGYNYKNTVSNAAFFQISARLARFTGNQTYAEWAVKSYDWMVQKGLIDGNYKVFDGISTERCETVNGMLWTYNTAITIYGAAVMYNFTEGSHTWKEKSQGLLDAATDFFGPPQSTPGVMFEPTCELTSSCNTDQLSFKAYLSRFLWATTHMAPFTTEKINSLLSTSAHAAARSCTGGSDRVTCGEKWYINSYDGNYGVGQQMAALETIQGLLAGGSLPPLRANHLTGPVKMCHNGTDAQCSAVVSTPTETDVVTSSLNPVAKKTPTPEATHYVSKLHSLSLDIAIPITATSSMKLSFEDSGTLKSPGIAKASNVINLNRPSPLSNIATSITHHRSNRFLSMLTIALILY